MAEKKTEDRIFTIEGIKKEWKRIRWPKWKKKDVNNNPTVTETFGEVVTFTGLFAVFFVACDFIATAVLKAI